MDPGQWLAIGFSVVALAVVFLIRLGLSTANS
jgi:hypothetical protein